MFEAPIDMLSFITLYPENWQRHSYVACCGTSIQPVLQMLEQAPQLGTILLCLDNDEAGHQASRRMREQLEMRYSVERLIPENKDWNDDLTLSAENAQGFSMEMLGGARPYVTVQSCKNQFYSDLVTPLPDKIDVPGTEIHIFYALKMGEKYRARYEQHFARPIIHEQDMQHEELLACCPEAWAALVKSITAGDSRH